MNVAKLAAAGLCATVALAVGAAPAGATTASAASTAVGSYTLNYEWHSAPGYWQTSTLVLSSGGTCTIGGSSACSWTASGSAFALSVPNPRRGGVTYKGKLTTAGLNTAAAPGHMYFGTTGATAQGDWYAPKA